MQALRSNPSAQKIWLIPGPILPESDWKTQRDFSPTPKLPALLRKTKIPNVPSKREHLSQALHKDFHDIDANVARRCAKEFHHQSTVKPPRQSTDHPQAHHKPSAQQKPCKPRISILFDGDNISSKVIPGLIQRAKEHGEIVHFKIFLRQNLRDCKTWQEAIKKFSLHTVCPKGEMRKNDTDECMASAAKQIIRKTAKKKIDVMCLVSNDHYFAKVMQDAKAAGKTVWSVGSKKTSLKLKAQCDEMIYVEPLLKMA